MVHVTWMNMSRLASEYERSVWVDKINQAQMSSLGRINEYEIRDLIDMLKHYTMKPIPMSTTTTIREQEFLSGYLSVSVDRATGFHKNCRVWVALETDFYGQFTTQARTRMTTTKKTAHRTETAQWNEDFEIEVDGCSELVALVLNNTDSTTDLLVAKGNLNLHNIHKLSNGEKTRCQINMTGGFLLEVTLKYTK